MDHPRIEELLDAMTLDEQVSLLSGADFWTTVPIPRLGVPALKVTDGPNGARGGIFKDGPTTACFPVGIALAATWNPALVVQAGAALGAEARLKGARVLLAPTVNLHRTVYNGRNFECHAEDPWLASEMAVAYVEGVQSAGVAATIKHYAGNESEHQRMSMSSDIPERALRELYLLPFERAVKQAGVMAVMTGYNRVDGVFMADHRRLVTEVLRDEWGFAGLVMTDWMAEHDTVLSILAGTDLEMPGPTRARGARLAAAVRDGLVRADDVRACARRVLQLADRLGSFADPVIPAERADDVPEHRTLIRRLGAEGTVLLKNESGALPLTPRAGQIVALIGRAATVPQIMGGGSANVNAHYRVAPADALKAACPGVRFTHHVGADLHRYTPVLAQPMTLDLYASGDLSGPVVATQTVPDSEVQWIGTAPPGIAADQPFSARTTLRYVADAGGEHAFSLIAAGVARATLNGEPVLDAWTGWKRGDTYFTFGCDEVTHRRTMNAGDVAELVVEFSSVLPAGAGEGPRGFAVLRVGAARVLGEDDIAEAVEAARVADVAIVFAGLNGEWDNEGLDRPGIELPHRQNELIARVAAANPRSIVVLQSGSPLLLPWLDAVPAVMQAWYPGQECGHAIADVLMGFAEPGGRLPQTWPARLEDTVAFGDPLQYPGVDGHVAYVEGLMIGYRHHDALDLAPLFPFGHGLSYTTFDWTGVRVEAVAPVGHDGGDFAPVYRVSVELRNTGKRTGSAVVQLYLAPNPDGGDDVEAALPRPPQALAGFCKLELAPGASGTATVMLAARAFQSYDTAAGGWVNRPGRYELRVAASSREPKLRVDLQHA